MWPTPPSPGPAASYRSTHTSATDHPARCSPPPPPGPAPGWPRVTSRTSGMPLRSRRLLTRFFDLVFKVAVRPGDVWRDAGGQVRRGGDRLDAVPVLVQ